MNPIDMSDPDYFYEHAVKPSAERLKKLLTVAIKNKNQTVEDQCNAAMKLVLGDMGDKSPRNPKDMTKKMRGGKHTPQELNFHLRFQDPYIADTTTAPTNAHKRDSFIFGSGSAPLKDYETVTSEAILNAPISNICIVTKHEVTPEGYYRLSRTPSNKKANLNTGSGGDTLYLCIKKITDLADNSPTISALVVIYPDRDEYVPPGYSVVRRGDKPCNLNANNNCERVFLGFKRDAVNACSPITDIVVFLRSVKEENQIPPNYIHLEKTIKNHDADINVSTSGCYIGLCYKQELATLNCLQGFKMGKSQLNRRTTMDIGTVFDEVLDSSKSRRITNMSSFDTTEMLPSHDESDCMRRRTQNSITDDESIPVVHQDSTLSEMTKLSDNSLNEGRNASVSFDSGVVQNTDQADDTSETSSSTAAKHLSSSSITPDLIPKASPPPQNLVNPLAITELSTKSLSANSMDKIVILSAHGSPLPRNVAVIMLALLTGLFSTGPVFNVSLDILTHMVENLNFFMEELRCTPQPNSYTILDLLITTLCERLDWAVEVVNKKILTLLQSLIKRSSGILSKSSTQQIFKGTMLVSSCHATSTTWIQKGYAIPMEDDSTDLFSYKVLKTLISSLCMRCEECDIDHSLPGTSPDSDTPSSVKSERMRGLSSASRGGGIQLEDLNFDFGGENEDEDADEMGDTLGNGVGANKTTTVSARYNVEHIKALGETSAIVVDLVTDFIDEVIDTVEISKITEIALLATSKKTSSTHSASFWVHLNSISKNLFTSYDVQNAFILLTALCKFSWLGMAPSGSKTDATPRHLGNKLLGLDGLFEFCRVAGQHLLLSKIFGYQIRRLVVSVIFVNMQYAMVEPKVFSKLLRLVTVLWENWREHIRLEFPVLCEQLIIKILQASSVKVYPIYQYLALEEVKRWFEQPHMLVEMFVNFDMDTAIVSDWNVFAHLIRVVCKLAEKAGGSGTSAQASNGSPWPTPYSEVGYADTLFGVNAVPIEPRDVKIKALDVAANMTRAMMDAAGHANLISQDIISQGVSPWVDNAYSDSEGEEDGNSVVDLDEDTAAALRSKKTFSLRIKIETYQKGADILKEGLAIYTKKNSIAKAIKFLVSKGFMSDTARDAASFLRLYLDNFAPSAIGDFLGEGGIPESPEEEYMTMVRYQFSRAVSFVDMSLDVSLRLYLTGCGFRMPGEAQKIERFVYTFARCFWEDNRNSECCPFADEDTVLLITYATIMLNTDLHHANSDKKRQKDKMTQVQFIRNLRGCNNGDDVDPVYLTAIYVGIRDYPIDWVENDVVIDTGDCNAPTEPEQNKKYVNSLIRNLRSSEDLLRSFSSFAYHFGIMGVDLSISMELIAYMFESVWHYFRSVADQLLERLANEENVIFSALDVAVNSLTSCIFIDMKVQKLAFVRQVTTFRDSLKSLDSCENSKSKIKASGKTFAKSSDAWYENVEKSTSKTAIPIIAEVHGVVTELKDVVRKCARREATKLVFARIESKAGVTDANRFIILEADLKKMTNKNGKFVPYRFFLFSDLLVYAHHGFTSYKVHLQIQLDDTAVNGIVAGDESGCCFSVTNPMKSFIVSCSTVAEKQQWYCAIKEASEAAIARKSGQRFAMLKRMQSQEIEVSERQQMHSSRLTSPMAAGGGELPKRRGSDSSYLVETPQVVEVPKGLSHYRKPLSNISAAVNDINDDDDGEEEEEEDGDAFEVSPVEKCSDYITVLDKRDSARVFITALKFWKGQLEVDNGMSPEVKLKLYGLYKTAKDGAAPPVHTPTPLGKAKPRASVVLTLHATSAATESPEDTAESVAARQLSAWQECGDMSSLEAMRTFVVTLFTVHPHWDYRLR